MSTIFRKKIKKKLNWLVQYEEHFCQRSSFSYLLLMKSITTIGNDEATPDFMSLLKFRLALFL